MKFVFIQIILCISTNAIGQSSFATKAKELYQLKEDSLLNIHLQKNKTWLKGMDKVYHAYYSSLYERYNGTTIQQAKYIRKAESNCAEEKCHDSIKAKIQDELAIISYRGSSQNVNEALIAINKSIALKKKLGNKTGLAKSLLIKGNIYYKNQSYQNGIDSSLNCYQSIKTLTNDSYLIDLANRNMAVLLINQKSWNKAEDVLIQNLKKERSSKNTRYELSTLNNLASLYTESGQLEKSVSINDTLLEYVARFDSSHLMIRAISNKAKLEDSLRNYKSASFWKDSLLNFEHKIFNQENLEALEKYKSIELEHSLTREQAKTTRNKFYIAGLMLALLSLSLLAYLFFRNQRLTKKSLETELENTKIKSAYNATLAKMEGEQSERQSIASVLHDQIASLLTASDMHLNVAQKKDTDKNIFINKASILIKDVNEQVRDLSHKLVSPTLLRFGLVAAFQGHLEKIGIQELQFNFSSNLDKIRIEKDKELFIFQSGIELVNNVIKHSGASKSKIYLNHSEDKLELKVYDNGDKKNKSFNSIGYGLTNMQNRTEAFGGNFKIEGKEKSTSVILSIPINLMGSI